MEARNSVPTREESQREKAGVGAEGIIKRSKTKGDVFHLEERFDFGVKYPPPWAEKWKKAPDSSSGMSEPGGGAASAKLPGRTGGSFKEGE